MFSLIVVIISILLVAVLMAAAIYYGGSAFSQSAGKADAAAVVNEASQLKGALEGYRSQHGEYPTGTEATIKQTLISSEYLSSVPNKAQWVLKTGSVEARGVSDDTCKELNVKFGIAADKSAPIPACTSPSLAGKTACCTD